MEVDSRISGAKNGVQTMLYYYLTALIDSGVKDPKQRIATEISKMIDLSDEQCAYVNAHVSLGNKAVESLSTSIQLLESNPDTETVSIVIGILKEIKKRCEDAVTSFLEEEYEDEQP